MGSQNLKLLLEKYWNGETTAEEEAVIKQYRTIHPEAFDKEDALLFDQLNDFSKLSLDADFTDDFMDRLEDAKQVKRPVFLWYRNIAAAVLLLITMSAIFYTWNENRKTALAQQAETRAAYEQAKQALALISSKLSKGAEITYSLDKFSTAQEKIKTEKLK